MANTIELTVSDNAIISASATTDTDILDINNIREYSMTFVKDSTDGNPIVEVLGSIDGVNFINPYVESDGVTPCTLELSDVINGVFDENEFLYNHIRVHTIPNGTTTGTLSIHLYYI